VVALLDQFVQPLDQPDGLLNVLRVAGPRHGGLGVERGQPGGQ
jgi:hypothetical protein